MDHHYRWCFCSIDFTRNHFVSSHGGWSSLHSGVTRPVVEISAARNYRLWRKERGDALTTA